MHIAKMTRTQSGERTNAKSDAVAYAGASVDGRNEGQKSLNVDVPEESLGMARLTDSLALQQRNFFFWGLYYKPQIWTAILMTLVGHKGLAPFLGKDANY